MTKRGNMTWANFCLDRHSLCSYTHTVLYTEVSSSCLYMKPRMWEQTICFATSDDGLGNHYSASTIRPIRYDVTVFLTKEQLLPMVNLKCYTHPVGLN